MHSRGLPHEAGVADRSRADDHSAYPLGQPPFDRAEVADAAAELDRDRQTGEHSLDGLRVDRLAGESAVKVDHVQIFEAHFLEIGGLRDGIDVEDRNLVHVAMDKANAFAVLEIDSWKKNHGDHRRKFAMSLRPSDWLFSG